MKYKTVLEVAEAIYKGDVNTGVVGTFDNKGELFINDHDGKTLFSSYYGTHNACVDVCLLLGLPEPDQV